jgi:hypothetical protein
MKMSDDNILVIYAKWYNNQGNAQVFYSFPYLFLPYMFRGCFKPIFNRHCVQIRQWF